MADVQVVERADRRRVTVTGRLIAPEAQVLTLRLERPRGEEPVGVVTVGP